MNFRYLRSLVNGRKLLYLLFLLFLVLFTYTFTMYNTITCAKQVKQAPVKPEVSPEYLDKLKEKWLAEYLEKNVNQRPPDEPPNDGTQKSVLPMECFINNDYAVSCLKETDGKEDVFMPFSFLQKYFEVYGKMKHYDGYDRFEFTQSYAKEVKKPTSKYNFKGVFMTFESYNVEVRDRVKCISGIEGVPISTQWGPQGYFYPIQIAQFGLSHYSKNLVQKPAEQTVYESGERTSSGNWKLPVAQSSVEIVDDVHRGKVVLINTPESLPLGTGASLSLGNTIEHVMALDYKFVGNGSITLYLDTNQKKQYKIHFITQDFLMDFDYKTDVKYGIGRSNEWRTLTRDLLIDLKKGVAFSKAKQIKKSSILIHKVSKIVIRGKCLVDNITLSTTSHMNNFRDAVKWMYKSQDVKSGGWKNEIERKLSGFETLKPGWISAMGQGQAMSLLSRAFYIYNDSKFVKALARALKPFTIPSSEGGVRAVFMNKYTWYEEYPTTPSLFVLNGFLYSVIGLYDFKSLIEERLRDSDGRFPPELVERFRRDEDLDIAAVYEKVTDLYEDGMRSAKAMLPLYDGGSRTFYDLRHFVLKTQPNVARWDYHATHLSQLGLLMTVSEDPVFKNFFEYWQGYTRGKVADHN